MRTLIAVVVSVALVVLPLMFLAGCGDDGPSGGADVEADLVVEPSQGTTITDFNFDAGNSTGGNHDLEYRWDWEADGTWDTDWTSEAEAVHRFTDGDTITVAVEVTNGSHSDTSSARVILDSRHGHMEEMFDLPAWVNPKDLAYDGAHIWITNWDLPTYKLDAITGDSLGTLPGNSLWTAGATWDGTFLWTVGYASTMAIFKQDPATGNILGSFPVTYSARSSGLDWDGTGGVFYYGSSTNDTGGDGRIHTYTAAGVEVASFPSPRGSAQPQGVAYDGVNAWVVIDRSDSLYVVNPADGQVLRVVGVPGRLAGPEIIGDHVVSVHSGVPKTLVRIVP